MTKSAGATLGEFGGDAEAGNHLERGEVDVGGVVARHEELLLGRLCDGLVLGGQLLLRLELPAERLYLPLEVGLLLEDGVDLEELALRLDVVHGVELLQRLDLPTQRVQLVHVRRMLAAAAVDLLVEPHHLGLELVALRLDAHARRLLLVHGRPHTPLLDALQLVLELLLRLGGHLPALPHGGMSAPQLLLKVGDETLEARRGLISLSTLAALLAKQLVHLKRVRGALLLDLQHVLLAHSLLGLTGCLQLCRSLILRVLKTADLPLGLELAGGQGQLEVLDLRPQAVNIAAQPDTLGVV